MSDAPISPIPLPGPIDLRPTANPAGERAQVRTLAQEFEAMLMLQMIRQMRQSMLDETEQSEGLGQSTLTDTFDVEFSRALARAGGVGFATFMVNRLEGRQTESGDAGSQNRVQVRGSAGAAVVGDVQGRLAAAATDGAGAAGGEMSAGRHAAPANGRVADSLTGEEGVKMPFGDSQTSRFGWRADPLNGARRFHGGVDLRAAYGTDVPAAAGGEVVFAGERGSYGNLVILRHASGVETRYAHLSAVGVSSGDRIAEGQMIGRVGSTGRSTAPHLHFEVLVNGERVDPERLASRLGRGPLKSDVSADD